MQQRGRQYVHVILDDTPRERIGAGDRILFQCSRQQSPLSAHRPYRKARSAPPGGREPIRRCGLLGYTVIVIATKRFIAAVARKCNLHIASSKPRHSHGRERGVVEKWFIELLEKARNQGQQVTSCKPLDCMFRAYEGGDVGG